MKTTVLTNRRRKMVNMSEDTFRLLSIDAASANTNLNAYIEHLLDERAKDLRESKSVASEYDSYFTPDMLAKIDRGFQQIKDGDCVTVNNKEELNALLDSL